MRTVIVFLLAVAVASALVDRNVDLSYLPMQNPDLFGGDMLGVDVVDRNVVPNPHLRWTGKKIPYVIDRSIGDYASLVVLAMENYHNTTCVRFVPRSDERNYIMIFSGEGCYSNIGMIGGFQPVSLGRGCRNMGTVVHELGHVLGFFHEHNRSDRDQYLTIYWDNIQEGFDSAFYLLTPEQNLLFDTFDYNSIMLYGSTAYSFDGGSQTMVAKNGDSLKEVYKKTGLSESDIIRIKKMYSC